MKYSETHEWVEVEGDTGVVGITHFAQKELGDIVYVELPAVNAQVQQGKEAVVLESTKAAADVYAPVSGTVTAVNSKLSSQPQLVNQSPEKEGWLFKVKLSESKDLDRLMDEAVYEKMVSQKG